MPTRANTHTTQPIKELFLRRNVENLICDQVSPTVYVNKKNGKYYRYDDANISIGASGDVSDVLSSRGGANEVDHDFSEAEYNIRNYGYKEWIDGDVYDDADDEIQQEARPGTLLNVKDKLLLQKERRLADLIFASGNYSGQTSALVGGDRWDDPNSTPTANFLTAASAVNLGSGYMVNSLILGWEAMLGLQYNPDILRLLSDNNEKVVTRSILSKILMTQGVNIPEQNIYVGSQTYKEEKTDATAQYIWGKSALFAYIDKKASTKKGDTLVKTFRQKDNKGDTYEFYPDPDKSKNGEWCYAKLGYGHEMVNFKCGYLFTTVVN